MAKQPAFSPDDLIPAKARKATVMRQRGVVPSAELVPLQFKLPPQFVRAFPPLARPAPKELAPRLAHAPREFPPAPVR